jgi:hypothetical protein
MKTKESISQSLTESEIRVALELLEVDQRDHLRNNSLSSTEFLDILTGVKLDNSEMLNRPAVVQTAFFLAAGGKE